MFLPRGTLMIPGHQQDLAMVDLLSTRLKRATNEQSNDFKTCNYEGEYDTCACAGCGEQREDETEVPCCQEIVTDVPESNFVQVSIINEGVEHYTHQFERQFKETIVEWIIWHCDEESSSCNDIYVGNIISSDLFVTEISSWTRDNNNILDIVIVLFVDKKSGKRDRRSLKLASYSNNANKLSDNHGRLVRSADQPAKATMSGKVIVEALETYKQTIEDRLHVTMSVDLVYKKDSDDGWTSSPLKIILVVLGILLLGTVVVVSSIRTMK